MDFNLEDVLSSKPYSIEEEEKQDNAPEHVKITQGALNKIKTYARLIERITGSANECYGFLLANKEGASDVVVNAYLADNQSYSGAHCSVNGEDIIRASDAVDPEDYKIVGWWHSHARFNVFHSGTDVNNFETVVHSVGPNTVTTEYEDVKLENIERNGKVDLGGYILDVTELKDAEIKKKHSYSWAYSLVVNIFGNVYTEVQTKELASDNEWILNDPSKDAGYEVVEVENDITLDAKVLENEVYSKLNVRRYTPITKTAVTQESSRHWSLFDVVDYMVGWFCGNKKKDKLLESIDDKVDKEIEKFQEQKEKEHEQNLAEYEKKLEEYEAKEAAASEEEVKEDKDAAETSSNTDPHYFNRLAQSFIENAKLYVKGKQKGAHTNRFWLDQVIVHYLQNQNSSFAEAVDAIAENTSAYAQMNFAKRKHRKKFIRRFADELSKYSALEQLTIDFVSAKNKSDALEILKLYKRAPSSNPTPEEKEIPVSEATLKAQEDMNYQDIGQSAAASVEKDTVAPEENESLLNLVRGDLEKEEVNNSTLANDFLDSFIEYINQSYQGKKNYEYNGWAKSTLNDFKRGFAGRGETFMRAAQCNLLKTRFSYKTEFRDNSKWSRDKMVEKAMFDLLNNPEFKMFVNSFMKEKDKDAVIEKFFSEPEPKKGKSIAVNHWGAGSSASIYSGPEQTQFVGFSQMVHEPRPVCPTKPDLHPTKRETADMTHGVYKQMFDSFFSSAKEYMINDGEYSAWLGKFLLKLAEKKERDIKKPIKKAIGKKTKEEIEKTDIETAIKKRFNWFTKGRPGKAEIKDRLFLEFIEDFKPETIPDFYKRVSQFHRNELFTKVFADTLAEYTMEGLELNGAPTLRKYCAWTGKLLEDLIRPEKRITFGKALENTGELADDMEFSTDFFYTANDKIRITNQLLLDLTCFVEPEKRHLLEEFMLDFASAYKSTKEDENPDQVLEEFMQKVEEVKECEQPQE